MTATGEKQVLRELAKRYEALANDPVMTKRTELWYRHNDGDRDAAPVIIEIDTFLKELLPELQCEDPFHRELERLMRTEIVRAEKVGDDKVISKALQLPTVIHHRQFDRVPEMETASELGFHPKPYIHELASDLCKLKPSVYQYDAKLNAERLERANEILPTVLSNHSLRWHVAYTMFAVHCMGMEDFYIAMVDEPEKVHEMMAFFMDDVERYLIWQQEQGILTPNNGNEFAGSGSYGFTHNLKGEPLLSRMWGNMNSQESVGLSPAMFGEFIYPYYLHTGRLFGKLYWGCCEPVDGIWDDYISKLPNLAKVSISAWCNESFMGERLRDSGVIYSRKPSPNYVGAADVFDEAGFAAHIRETVRCAKGCNLEIIMRDIYTLCGDEGRAKRAVEICRRELDKR